MKMRVPKISVTSTLTVLLIIFKLTGFIDWSWWFVFIPIWGSILLAGVLILIANIIELFE